MLHCDSLSLRFISSILPNRHKSSTLYLVYWLLLFHNPTYQKWSYHNRIQLDVLPLILSMSLQLCLVLKVSHSLFLSTAVINTATIITITMQVVTIPTQNILSILKKLSIIFHPTSFSLNMFIFQVKIIPTFLIWKR